MLFIKNIQRCKIYSRWQCIPNIYHSVNEKLLAILFGFFRNERSNSVLVWFYIPTSIVTPLRRFETLDRNYECSCCCLQSVLPNSHVIAPGRRDDMSLADGSSTCGGSTSVRGRVRSPHTAKLQAASVPIAQGSCAMGQTDGSRYSLIIIIIIIFIP